jgi:hypothetical protein
MEGMSSGTRFVIGVFIYNLASLKKDARLERAWNNPNPLALFPLFTPFSTLIPFVHI